MPKQKLLSSPKKRSVKSSPNKSKKNHSLRNKVLGLLFLSFALALVGFPIYPQTQTKDNKNPIVINSNLLKLNEKQNNPLRIIVPKSNIDLAIVNAPVISGFWEVSETNASYGLGSGQPGTKSNTVIFAHAREGLFYNLKDVELNDTIYVFTKSKWFRYKVNKITSVYPDDITVIQPTKNETLTLYTCTGFYDEKRLIITAFPQN